MRKLYLVLSGVFIFLVLIILVPFIFFTRVDEYCSSDTIVNQATYSVDRIVCTQTKIWNDQIYRISPVLVFKDSSGNVVGTICSDNDLGATQDRNLWIEDYNESGVLISRYLQRVVSLEYCSIAERFNCVKSPIDIDKNTFANRYQNETTLENIYHSQDLPSRINVKVYYSITEYHYTDYIHPDETLHDYGCRYRTGFSSRMSW
jgi:hypothetical protein